MNARPVQGRLRRALTLLLFAAATLGGCASESPRLHRYVPQVDARPHSLAYAWLDIAEEATARDVELNMARPTVQSRTLAIWATAMFDAWAAYDDKAVGSRLGDSLRRPAAERTLANKQAAISYASLHALRAVYPHARGYLDAEMRGLGYDPEAQSEDLTTPVGVGIRAAQAVLAYRRHDGSNQFGDDPGSDGTPYGDTTGYRPVNPPDRIVDPDRWQPIEFTLDDGRKVTPGFLTPHWGTVTPFLLERADQFRPGPPPTLQSDPEMLREQTAQVLAYNNSLTDAQKAIVEFMRDGPRSTGQSGHWLRFAQDVSRRDDLGLDAVV